MIILLFFCLANSNIVQRQPSTTKQQTAWFTQKRKATVSCGIWTIILRWAAVFIELARRLEFGKNFSAVKCGLYLLLGNSRTYRITDCIILSRIMFFLKMLLKTLLLLAIN